LRLIINTSDNGYYYYEGLFVDTAFHCYGLIGMLY